MLAERGISVLVVAPDSAQRIQQYYQAHEMHFSTVSDPKGELLKVLGQEINWLKLGRMPGLIGIDRDGHLVVRHRGKSMSDLPDFTVAADAVARPDTPTGLPPSD